MPNPNPVFDTILRVVLERLPNIEVLEELPAGIRLGGGRDSLVIVQRKNRLLVVGRYRKSDSFDRLLNVPIEKPGSIQDVAAVVERCLV